MKNENKEFALFDCMGNIRSKGQSVKTLSRVEGKFFHRLHYFYLYAKQTGIHDSELVCRIRRMTEKEKSQAILKF